MLIPFLQPERASWEQSEYTRLFGKRGEIQKSSPYSFSLWRARLRHPAEWPSSTCLLICITSLPHISSEYSRLQWQQQFWRRIRTPNFGYVDHGHIYFLSQQYHSQICPTLRWLASWLFCKTINFSEWREERQKRNHSVEDMGNTGRERVSEKGLLREHHTRFLLMVSARQSGSSKSLFSLSSICSYELEHIAVCLTEWSPNPASILGASRYTTKNAFPSITGWGPRMDSALCWSTLLNQTIAVLHFIAFDNKTLCNVMQKLKMRKELKVYLSNEESYC